MRSTGPDIYIPNCHKMNWKVNNKTKAYCDVIVDLKASLALDLGKSIDIALSIFSCGNIVQSRNFTVPYQNRKSNKGLKKSKRK